MAPPFTLTRDASMPRRLAFRGIRAAALAVVLAGACIEPRNDPAGLDAATPPDTRRMASTTEDAAPLPDAPAPLADRSHELDRGPAVSAAAQHLSRPQPP